MSVDSRIKKKTAIFGNWTIDGESIGDGSGRKNFVYKLKRGHGNWQEYCALKVIPVIEEYGSLDLLSPDEQNSYGERLFQKTQKAKEEIINMEKLRGNTHIVDYLDFDFVDWSEDDCFGRDMYIRMELLHDLRSELKHNRIYSEEEIIKIGCDICDALILCHGNGILHRDIKPDNIFVNKNGNYKLGDFGISKSMPDVVHGYAGTGIGAFAYMPAEQLKGKSNNRVDIYSLGLVLYELCNGNKLPFAQEQFVTDQEVIQRLSGKKFPKPSNASSKLAEVILKACAFNPKDRYPSAEEFQSDLENMLTGGPVNPSDIIKKIIVAVCFVAVCLALPWIIGIFREKHPIVTSPTSIPGAETEYNVPEQETEDAIPQEVVFEDLEPGAIIELGEYEQDGNVANGPEPIEWLVLTTEGNEALVISTLGLDTLPYENTKEKADWEGCSLRSWLEDTFYKNVFSNDEKDIIAEKTIIQHENEGYPYCEQGDDTIDHVFLLSTEEYIEYLYNNQAIDPVNRQGIPSAYAQKKNIDIYDYHEGVRSWWWLRTSSGYNDKACFVAAMGPREVYVGYTVNTNGGLIRPAMWISFTNDIMQDETKPQEGWIIGENSQLKSASDVNEDDFILFDTQGYAEDELCILGYRNSIGMKIEAPYIIEGDDMFEFGFVWEDNSEITATRIGAGRNHDINPAMVESTKTACLKMWGTGFASTSRLEYNVNSTFGFIPEETYYALLLSFDKNCDLVAYTVLKIGYPNS